MPWQRLSRSNGRTLPRRIEPRARAGGANFFCLIGCKPLIGNACARQREGKRPSSRFWSCGGRRDGNGAASSWKDCFRRWKWRDRSRRTSNKKDSRIEATKGQVLAPNALKSRDRGRDCTAPGPRILFGSVSGRSHWLVLFHLIGTCSRADPVWLELSSRGLWPSQYEHGVRLKASAPAGLASCIAPISVARRKSDSNMSRIYNVRRSGSHTPSMLFES